jgi:hypothetical protein
MAKKDSKKTKKPVARARKVTKAVDVVPQEKIKTTKQKLESPLTSSSEVKKASKVKIPSDTYEVGNPASKNIAIKKQPLNVSPINNLSTAEKAAEAAGSFAEAEESLLEQYGMKKGSVPETSTPSTKNYYGDVAEEMRRQYPNMPEGEELTATGAKKLKSPKLKTVPKGKIGQLLEQAGSLSDEALKGMGSIGNKILENKYVAPVVPVAKKVAAPLMFLDTLREAKNFEEELGKKQYLDAASSGMGAAAGASLFLGQPQVAAPLYAGSLAGKGLSYGIDKYNEFGDNSKKMADMLRTKPELTEGFKTVMGSLNGDSDQTPSKMKPQDYMNLFQRSKMGRLSNEQILNQLDEYNFNKDNSQNRSPDSISENKTPSKGEIVNYAIEQAKHYGIDPAQALAILQQESGFNINAVSKTGARGLGQMFPDAYADAQQEDKEGVLKDLDYKTVHSDPSQWKKQVDASLLYQKAIQNRYNKSGTPEEALLRYVGGPSASKEDVIKRGTDPDEYINRVKGFSDKWKQTLGDENLKTQKFSELDRSPAIHKFNQDENSIFKYLSEENPEDAQLALRGVMPEGPLAKSSDYVKRDLDTQRLQELRDKYLNKEDQQPLAEQAPEEPEQKDDSSLMQDYVNLLKKESGFSQNTVEKLKQIQDEAKNLRALNMLVQGAEQAGRGIAGAMSGFEVKGGTPFTGLQEEAEKMESEFKAQTDKEMEDPGSQYSASLRNVARPVLDKMKVDPTLIDNMSGAQITKILPQLKDMYDAQVRADYVKEKSDTAREDKKSLINQRTFAQLPMKLESLGGASGTRLRNRIQQAGNIYGTLGVNPKDLESMSDSQVESKLDEAKKLQAVEAAIELNAMLSGSGTPAQKTLEKLLLNSGYQTGMSAAEYLSNRQFQRNQGSYLKDIVKITARAEKYAAEQLRNKEVQALSGMRRLADDPVVGEDFVNYINKRGITLDELSATPKSEKASKVNELKRIDRKTGKTAVFDADTKQFIRWE